MAEAEQKLQLEAQAKQLDMKYKQMEAILKAQIAKEQHDSAMGQQAESHALGMATKAREHTQKMQQQPKESNK